MKFLILLLLLITACNFKYQAWEKGDFKLIRCSYITGCDIERTFQTRESCEEIKTKLVAKYNDAYTCEEVK